MALSRRPTRAVVAGAASAAAAQAAAATDEAHPSLDGPADSRAAAFFDVDGTVVQGASIFHLARGLYRREFFTSRDIARFGWQQARFRLMGGEHLGHMEQARETALAFIAGHGVRELESIGQEIFDELISDRIWPGTRALAQLHLRAGQRVWLVTATPVEVAQVIAHRLGLTGALGTVAESRDGVYTGRLVGEPLHGEAKAEAVRALATRERLDLSRCSAYSDSHNDLPMLSLVGHPCAINPDKRLRSHARSQGWRVRDYRTGRRAARIGIPTAAGAGAATGAALALAAVRRRRA